MTKKTDPILTHGGDWAGFAAEYGAQAPLLDFFGQRQPAGAAGGGGGGSGGVRLRLRPLPRPPLPGADGGHCPGRGGAGRVGPLRQRRGRPDLAGGAGPAAGPGAGHRPAFAEYEAALAAVGCRVERYALREAEGFRLDEGFLEAIRPGVGMVFLCEPNNPTGLTSPRPLLLRVLERCRQAGALLVADECFGDFLAAPAAHTLKGALEGGGLLLLKAFTKLYGMAGVRLGYGLCADPALLAKLRAAGQPWAVSTPAQAAGLAALKETGYVQAVRALIADQRPRLAAGLAALGCQVLPGEANYLLFRCGTPLAEPLRGGASCCAAAPITMAWARTGTAPPSAPGPKTAACWRPSGRCWDEGTERSRRGANGPRGKRPPGPLHHGAGHHVRGGQKPACARRCAASSGRTGCAAPLSRARTWP